MTLCRPGALIYTVFTLDFDVMQVFVIDFWNIFVGFKMKFHHCEIRLFYQLACKELQKCLIVIALAKFYAYKLRML